MKYAMVLLLTVLACREVNIGGEYAVGTVINLGDPAADGCGWVVVGETETFFPQDLPKRFQEDSLRVRFRYRVVKDSSTCAWMTVMHKTIALTDIKRS